MIPLVLAIAGEAARQEGTKDNAAMARRNAKISKLEGIAGQRALNARAELLSKSQREQKAQARVNIAASGGSLADEQPLMMMQEMANDMQLDQIELRRQGTIARQRGESGSLLSRMQGKNIEMQGYANLANTAYSIYGAKK